MPSYKPVSVSSFCSSSVLLSFMCPVSFSALPPCTLLPSVSAFIRWSVTCFSLEYTLVALIWNDVDYMFADMYWFSFVCSNPYGHHVS